MTVYVLQALLDVIVKEKKLAPWYWWSKNLHVIAGTKAWWFCSCCLTSKSIFFRLRATIWVRRLTVGYSWVMHKDNGWRRVVFNLQHCSDVSFFIDPYNSSGIIYLENDDELGPAENRKLLSTGQLLSQKTFSISALTVASIKIQSTDYASLSTLPPYKWRDWLTLHTLVPFFSFLLAPSLLLGAN